MDSSFNIIWDKTIGTEGFEHDPDIIVLSDSSFIMACQVELGNNYDVGLPMFDTVAFGTGWQRGDIWVSKWYIPNPAQVQEMSLASFNLYPNPVKDILYITLQNAKNKTYHLHVQDMQGRMVVQRQLTITNSNTIMLESHDWQPGVYVVNIEGVSKKVVKL
ncbi:MAG: T9SS type A sorting domain-containing protein [Bacteroidetes bacterium]|nr:T9SS type A sorting domain-containing protein [Bacteroidota bacterium]